MLLKYCGRARLAYLKTLLLSPQLATTISSGVNRATTAVVPPLTPDFRIASSALRKPFVQAPWRSPRCHSWVFCDA